MSSAVVDFVTIDETETSTETVDKRVGVNSLEIDVFVEIDGVKVAYAVTVADRVPPAAENEFVCEEDGEFVVDRVTRDDSDAN